MAGSLLFLGLVAALAAVQSAHTSKLDPVTACALNRPVAGDVVILVDATDPFAPSQVQALAEWLRELQLTELRANERVTLWLLGTTAAGGLERRFCRCYPGREDDVVLHNPAMLAAICDSLFARPLRESLSGLDRVAPARRSAILEAIRELAEQPELLGTGRPRRLVVVSDLEQNDALLSLCRRVPTFAAFSRSASFGSVRAQLSDVDVDLLYASRGTIDASRSERLREFWREYLLASGAASVRVRRL